MHHAAAQNFEPILAFPEANLAILARALDIDFHRRFGERKIARPEAHLDVRHFEEGLAEFLKDPFQIAEIGGAVDYETFDLVEHRRMRLVRVATIGPARTDHPD